MHGDLRIVFLLPFCIAFFTIKKKNNKRIEIPISGIGSDPNGMESQNGIKVICDRTQLFESIGVKF